MVAKGYIPAGTVLRKSMFHAMDKAGIPAKLNHMSDKVAIALSADLNTTLGGIVEPGNKVTVKASDKGATYHLVTKTELLATPDKGTEKAVVLAVTPYESHMIWDAISSGKTIWFELLKSEEELSDNITNQQPVTTEQQVNQPIPEHSPPAQTENDLQNTETTATVEGEGGDAD